MSNETPNMDVISIRDFTVTRLGEKQKALFIGSKPNFIVATIDGQQTRIDLRPGTRDMFSNNTTVLTLNRTSNIIFEIFHDGFTRNTLLGRITMSEGDIRDLPPGVHKQCQDVVVARKVKRMQLSFSLETSRRSGQAEPSPPSFNHDVAATVAVQSAADAAALISEPQLVAVAIDATDHGIVQSAHAAIDVISAYYAPLEEALNLVDRLLDVALTLAEIHPVIKTASLALSSAYLVVRKQTELDASVKELAEAMVKLFSWVKEADGWEHKLERFRKTIEMMAQQATECALFIKDYTSRGFLGRTVNSNLNNVDLTVQRFRGNFDALLGEFDRGAIASTFTLLTRSDTTIRDILDKLQDNQARDHRQALMASLERNLPHVAKAYFDSSRTCLPGTRQGVLDEIHAWSREANDQSIYWLKAEAGAGKSTISHTVAHQAEQLGQLGGCFFLHRDYADRRDPRLIINTLAFRLAHFHPDIADAMRTALDNNPDLGSIDSIEIKFNRLVLEPIATVKTLVEPILVVIDDLDALDTKDDDARSRRRDFLRYINRHHQKFPPALKVFITSRPERDVVDMLKRIKPHVLHHSSDDIARLARKLLEEVPAKFNLQRPWPDSAIVDALVRRSGDLFIWIKTACDFIAHRDPQRRLKLVLEGDLPQGAGSQLNKLYRDALLNHAEKEADNDDEFYERFRIILGCIVHLRNPLTPEAIDSLLELPPDIQSLHTINLFESFLLITEEGVVRPIHPSFAEFLTNKDRCKSPLLFIGLEHRQNLTKRCLEMMLSFLKRNVCDLEDPLIRNSIIIQDKIPKDLLYACQFWADHLQSVEPDEGTYHLVEEFLLTKVIFWLEVLSLAGRVDDAIPALVAAQGWLEKYSALKTPELFVLINDVQHFVLEFRPVMVKSAGYIYESALPLTPQRTILFEKASNLKALGKLPSVWGAYHNWEPHQTIEVRSSPVRSAAWSPDGTKIVIGAENHNIFVCNAVDGSFIGEPFRGHTGGVVSVAFSPDGKTIASGSMDSTICIWNVDNILIHKIPVDGQVLSVAFSPDGLNIVVASWRIYIFNVEDGTLVLWFQPTGFIHSAAFSPDGHRLVSGSSNGEVCIWNALDGAPAGDPFIGHSNVVRSVAFSPDGERVVSGSDDKTICVWDATNGTLVCGPLTGHIYDICSVGFSPDGMKIISGSNDNSIRMWDAIAGTQIGRPLRHTSTVYTVAFSPNGSQILSGSHDATLRIWSVIGNDLLREPVIGHSDSVMSLAFSPDGFKVVSGSRDCTICCWNAANGTLLGTPLIGHTDSVSCVSFSPDGTKIASASADWSVRIWTMQDKTTVSLILEGHIGHVWGVGFSPNGTRVISVSEDSTLRIWDASDGTQIGELHSPVGRSDVMSFSPDGTKFISSDEECSIQLWDTTEGTSAGHLQGHRDTVITAAFSPDGTQIISCSFDGNICLWNVADESIVFTIPHHYFHSWRGTSLGMCVDNEIPMSILALYDLLQTRPNGPTLSGGWIRIPASSKRLWIPPRYRQSFVVNGSRVCIGTSTGNVVFVETAQE